MRRVYVAQPGPFTIILALAVLALIAAIMLIVLLSVALIWIPVVIMLIATSSCRHVPPVLVAVPQLAGAALKRSCLLDELAADVHHQRQHRDIVEERHRAVGHHDAADGLLVTCTSETWNVIPITNEK